MRRLLVWSLFALAASALCLPVAAARAMMIAPPPLPNRVALADCVVIGKVTSLEKKVVMVRPFPGNNNRQPYHVAVITIKDRLAGAKGLTAVRVGFYQPPQVNNGPIQQVKPNQPVFRPIRRYPQVDLKVGQEACFLLNQHFEEPFFVISNYTNVIAKGNTFDKDVAQIKHFVKLLAEPKKGLKAKTEDDRLTTAGMLITRYRSYQPGVANPPKTEPISAEQSRLILAALAETDWTKQRQFGQLQPVQLFAQLGLTEKDGWTQPKVFKNYLQDMSNAGKAWIKAHGKDYRIQRIVVEKENKK
jgi:hypothetical protein